MMNDYQELEKKFSKILARLRKERHCGLISMRMEFSPPFVDMEGEATAAELRLIADAMDEADAEDDKAILVKGDEGAGTLHVRFTESKVVGRSVWPLKRGMTKQEAIKWYCEISDGKGVDRNKHLDVIGRGALAIRHWNDGEFTLGVEYGVLIALVEAYGLTNEDLSQDETEKEE